MDAAGPRNRANPRGDSVSLWLLWFDAARIAPVSFLALALSILVGGATQILVLLPSAHIVQLIADHDGRSHSWRALLPSVAAMCTLLLAAAGARAVVNVYGWRIGRKFNGTTRVRVMSAASAFPDLAALEDSGTRDRLNTAIGVGPSRYNPGGALLRTSRRAVSAMQTVTVVAVLCLASPWTGLIVAATIIACRVIFGRVLRAYATQLLAHVHDYRRLDHLRALMWHPATARELRVFDMWDWTRGQIIHAWLEIERRQRGHRRTVRPAMLASAAVFTVGFGGAFLLAFQAWSHGRLSVQDGAVVFQTMVILAIAMTRTVVDADQGVELGARSVPAVRELIRTAENSISAGRNRLPTAMPVAISCRGLTFGYAWRENDAPVLNDLCLDIDPGQNVAIVGRNGAGKSTLLKLICGFYPVPQGMLTIGGVDSAELNQRGWQRSIAAVQQDYVRYPRSLLFNVAAVRDAEVDRDLALQCLSDVGLAELPETLPDGLQTILLVNHALSGGQWQRVALARALYRLGTGARILVLDEPTANLDPSAELSVSTLLATRAAATTTITVSHRLPLVREADSIMVMEGGRIVESGNHDTLLQADEFYAAMFRTQSIGWDGA